MKPVTLEFCGINSFSEPQKIDFESLLQFGIFGIFGDTGSGKSTILDCIGFALYGDVLRARSGKIADIINYGKDRAYVNLEFDIDYAGKRRRYRVERELKLKNASQNLKVYEYDEDKAAYLCVADAVRQGNELLERIIGLEQKDYEKCIALPQGEFAQFVKSARGDRLKLVSRLFDLERYGEKLVSRTNTAFRQASNAVEISRAKLLPYESFSQEGIDRLKKDISVLEKDAKLFKDKLDKMKAEEKKLSALLEKHQEAKVFLEKYQKLNAEMAGIDLLEKELNQLVLAAAVQKAEGEFHKTQAQGQAAETALKNAKQRLAAANEAVKFAQAWDSEKAEAELAAFTEQRLRCDEQEKSAKRAKELQEKLRLSREKYKKVKDSFAGFDYEEQKRELEARIASLQSASGGGLPKAAFFREEYAEFKGELSSIQAKFPQTEKDVSPLIEKYTKLSEGESADFSLLNEMNAEREAKLSKLNAELASLQEKNGDYKAHLVELKTVEAEGLRLKEELEEITKQIDKALSREEVERQIARLKNDAKDYTQKIEESKRALSLAEAEFAVAEEREKTGKALFAAAKENLEEALRAGNFKDAAAADKLIEKYGDEAGAKERVKKFREEYAAAKAGYENLKDIPVVDEKEVESLKAALIEAEKESESCVTSLALKRDELVRGESALKAKRELEKELRGKEREAALYEQLKKLLEGNKFMEFVAEEYLTTVALNASGRLLTLTNGQYFLKYDGGFFVGDNLHGGSLRGVNTLSGGETFLVSLSLALSLSQEICARNLRSSEFFFLDEGFGTLDSKLVDTVMDSLEKLKGENFSIGIISHVEELKHRITRKLTVKKATEQHGSQIISE